MNYAAFGEDASGNGAYGNGAYGNGAYGNGAYGKEKGRPIRTAFRIFEVMKLKFSAYG
ncbi:hypothetical protein [Sphingorhabdus lutea]|uniref:hypothetical protein n=1 Tax=Sphingorhabdus lutea TaxID=1913578 RepID=UPI000AB4C8C1|nr:hypothetical protein [Sphingorhabdus lutea]